MDELIVSCGEKEIVWVTWREWCWKGWGPFKVPWRCTKGEYLERYRYDFAIVRPYLGLFHTNTKDVVNLQATNLNGAVGFVFFVSEMVLIITMSRSILRPLLPQSAIAILGDLPLMR